MQKLRGAHTDVKDGHRRIDVEFLKLLPGKVLDELLVEDAVGGVLFFASEVVVIADAEEEGGRVDLQPFDGVCPVADHHADTSVELCAVFDRAVHASRHTHPFAALLRTDTFMVCTAESGVEVSALASPAFKEAFGSESI